METRHITWNNIDFHFNKNKSISMSDFWSWLMPISNGIYNIFISIISSEEIKKIAFYDDPTELTIS